MPEVVMALVDRIRPNPFQPRVQFDQQALDELACSIRENGVIQPIVLLRDGDGYILIAGERRWRAAQMAGCKDILAVVHDHLSEEKMAAWALVENLCRDDLDPISEAKGYKLLMEKFGISIDEIAAQVGRHRATIKNTLLLLELDSEIQDLVARGILPRDARVAKAFLSIPDREARIKLATRLGRYEHVTIKTAVTACEKLAAQLSHLECNNGNRQALDRARVAERGNLVVECAVTAWPTMREAATAVCHECDIRASTLSRVREPAWALIVHASEDVCGDCSVRDIAAACEGCPQVDLLRYLIRATMPESEKNVVEYFAA